MKKIILTIMMTILLVTNMNTAMITAQDTNYQGDQEATYSAIPPTDHHMHMMSANFAEVFKKLLNSDTYNGTPIEEINGDKIISLLDEVGIDKGFVLSSSYIYGMDAVNEANEYDKVMEENNFLASEVAKYPERLIGFFSVNPLKDYAIKEVKRCYEELNLSGLKLHLTNSDVNLRNEEHLYKIVELFTQLAEQDIPVLLHLRSRSADFGTEDANILIDKVIKKIPNLKLQLAHLGGWGGFDRSTKEVLATFTERFRSNPELRENIYFDISGIIVSEREMQPGLDIITDEDYELLANMMREWGLEHIVFGTDYQYQTPKGYLEYMRNTLPMTEEEIEDILDNDLAEVFFEQE